MEQPCSQASGAALFPGFSAGLFFLYGTVEKILLFFILQVTKAGV